MSVGLPVSKDEINTRAGDTARAFQRAFVDAATMQLYLVATTEQQLIDLGFTANEVAVLKTAYNDLEFLGQIWTGTATLPALKDFRTFVRQLWGVGAF
jgi:hypothetical protein